MTKLGKQMYLTNEGRKINSYKINIPKEIIEKANMQNVKDVKIHVSGNKIIIEKE